MEKKIFSVIGLLIVFTALIVMFAGCGNRDMFDTVYTYNRAIIQLPDGTIVNGPITKWRDYEDGDQIQVEINGKIYLVHSEDIVLIQD